MLSIDPNTIAALHHVHPDSNLATILSPRTIDGFAKAQLPQTIHRINVLRAWDVDLVGKSVLEIGCGQGDASTVLANAVDDGRVAAWDPADANYGSPLTVGQAQANLTSKPSLRNLTFHLGVPLADLLNTAYDFAILLHCIYYFPSPLALRDTLRDLHPRATKLCIAEYALRASTPDQQPHVLAVLAEQALELFKPKDGSQPNVQTVLSPRGITEIAKESGWVVESEHFIKPDLALQDGRWEVGTVYSSERANEVESVLGQLEGDMSRQGAWLRATRDAVVAAVDGLGVELSSGGRAIDRVRTMDVWCAVFKRA